MHRTRVSFLEVLTEAEGEGQEGSNAPPSPPKKFSYL
jgi:hypothetical protein